MESRELFRKYNRFYLDTPTCTIDVRKTDGELVSIIKYKFLDEDIEISNPTQKDIIPWINRNKLTIQFG